MLWEFASELISKGQGIKHSGEYFRPQVRCFYIQLRMYIHCKLVPETTYWLAFEIFLSTSDFKHGYHCTYMKIHEACAQQVKTAVVIHQADHDKGPCGHTQQQTTK
jgi:hypothetical protein